MQIGDSIEIRNFITDEYLLGGKISKITDNPAGYSIDGILFVNPNSSRIRVNKVITPLFDRCFNEKWSYFTFMGYFSWRCCRG